MFNLYIFLTLKLTLCFLIFHSKPKLFLGKTAGHFHVLSEVKYFSTISREGAWFLTFNIKTAVCLRTASIRVTSYAGVFNFVSLAYLHTTIVRKNVNLYSKGRERERGLWGERVKKCFALSNRPPFLYFLFQTGVNLVSISVRLSSEC